MDLMCLSKTIAVKQTSVHLSQTVINNMFLFCCCGIKSDSKRADFLCYQQILEARYVIQAGAYRIVVQSVLITRWRLQLSDISAQLWGLSWASRCTFYTKYYSYHKALLRSCTPNPFHHHLHILEAFSRGRQVRPMDGCPVFQTTPLLVMRTCKLKRQRHLSTAAYTAQLVPAFSKAFLSSVQLVNRVEHVVPVSSAVHASYLYFLLLVHQ